MTINEIKIPDYIDAHSRDGYNIIPQHLNVLFEIGKCKDWITIAYIVPTDEEAIIKEIKRILMIPYANPKP